MTEQLNDKKKHLFWKEFRIQKFRDLSGRTLVPLQLPSCGVPSHSSLGTNSAALSFYSLYSTHHRLPRWLSGEESASQCRKGGFNPWSRKIPWRRKWQPTPVFLPEKPHGQRSLVGYSLWGRKESDST